MSSEATSGFVSRCAQIAWLPLIACCGCAQRPTEAVNQSATSDRAISVRITGVEGYNETIAQLRGKVVLVDFWATWCLPCLEQFPHTVELARKHRDQGLAVVSVSLNKPDEEPKVREFLVGQDARFDNLLSEYRTAIEAGESFGLPGPVPCYRVYDREGKLRRAFAIDPAAKRQFTPADVEAAVAELL